MLLFRTAATEVSTRNSELSSEKRTIILMCAMGLVPATLAILAVNLGIPLANSFLNIVTYVIILTNIVAAGGAVLSRRSDKQASENSGQDSTKGIEE